MVGNVDVYGKFFKDVVEMIGYDIIVFDILKMGKGEMFVFEKCIKEVYKVIMYELELDKIKQIGEWKIG